MPANVDFIIGMLDKTRNAFSSINSSFGKVNDSAKKTQAALHILPNSIKGLEKELNQLRLKQKNAFTVEGIKHYQHEIDLTEKKLNNLNRHTGRKQSSLEAISEGSPMLGGALSTLTSPIGLAVAGAGVLYQGLKQTIGSAVTFTEGMAKANTTLQLTPDKLKSVTSEVLALGKKSTTALKDVPQALFMIASGMGGDLPASMEVLKMSLKGAEAGFADINAVSDATVNTMNSVGKANTTAAEVADVLFATLNKGKGEFADVANYLPKLIPISNMLGISFKETAGAFAFLTANGLKSEAATTSLQNVFKAFQTEKIRESLKNAGVSVFDANKKMRSMAAISLDLGKSLDGLTDEERVKKLESLGLDQEAALGLSIMSSKAEELGVDIDYVNKSGGELDRTLAASHSPMSVLKKLGNQFSGLMVGLGLKILPTVNAVLEKSLGWITGISEGFSNAYNNSVLFRDVISAIGTIMGGIWDAATISFSAFSSQLEKTSKQMEEQGLSWASMGDNLEKGYVASKIGIQAFGAGFMSVLDLLKKAWKAFWAGDLKDTNAFSIENISKAFDKGYNETKTKLFADYNKTNINETTPIKKFINPFQAQIDIAQNALKNKPAKTDGFSNTPIDKGGVKTGLNEGISNVSGGGSQQKNITIKFDQLIGSLNINSQTITEGIGEMQDKIEAALLRVLNSANSY